MIPRWIFLLFVAAFFLSSAPPRQELMVIKEKKVTVKGNTSWGKFNCNLKTNGLCDTLMVNKKGQPIQFSLPVKDFGCGNFLLNKDFQSTLKADQYPHIKVEVLSLHKTRDSYLGNLRIQIAGTTNLMREVPFVLKCTPKSQSLVADLSLQFGQFNLEPPRKLGGLLTVDEHLLITVEMGIED
jgi:hypothetical protein